jgi:hypothetical protein
LKSSEQGSAEATVDVLRSCLPSDVLNSANESRVLVRLVEILTTGFSPDKCDSSLNAWGIRDSPDISASQRKSKMSYLTFNGG